MLIDCGQCEFRKVACGDCLVTVLPDNGSRSVQGSTDQKREKDVSNSKDGAAKANIAPARPRRDGAASGRDLPGGGPRRQALGALELRALGALAAADLVPPLRFRPVRKVTREVVAL